MPNTASRLEAFNACRIREMTRFAEQRKAINLAQGFPDFDPPHELIAAAHLALDSGFNQYALSWGSPRLRAALALKQERFMGLALDPDRHITITCGATEAMMAATLTVCDPGDKVIVFSPFYENYRADIALSGAVSVCVQLYPPEFTFDPQELRKAFQAGAKALILCNPSNPTGRVFTLEELRVICDLAHEFDAWVITDEVYEHIVYPPNRHTYVASMPEMFNRTISCGSFSKTYSVTGWRLGYVIAEEETTAGIRKVHDFLTVGAPAPLQEAATCALSFPDEYYSQLASEYQRRRDIFTGCLNELGVPYILPQGSYFCLADIGSFDFVDDFEFCNWLIEEAGVAAVPGSVFFDQSITRFVRFHFSKREETLHEAGRRLLSIRQKV